VRSVRVAQLGGSSRARRARALRNATWLGAIVVAAGCARGRIAERAADAAPPQPPDARSHAIDASVVQPIDAPVDAGCSISAGTTIALDGNGDLAKYPASAHVAPGAMLGSDDVAIVWDRKHLYVTVASSAFASAYEPLHLYLQVAPVDAATPGTGKEYSNLVPALPFTATHLVAARRVSDSGSGPYDGVYVPAMTWDTRQTPLAPAADVFVSSDFHQLSVQVPWTALGGCPTSMRLAVHVVNAVQGNEWKDVIPTTHTPWQSPGGGYYAIDLTGDPATAMWMLH
jgi:hypothetical protein